MCVVALSSTIAGEQRCHLHRTAFEAVRVEDVEERR
jgi:hypothetical protein